MSKIKWGGRRPSITIEQYARLLEIKALKQVIIPSYSQLAKEWGVSVQNVLDAVSRGIKRYDYELHQKAICSPEPDNDA